MIKKLIPGQLIIVFSIFPFCVNAQEIKISLSEDQYKVIDALYSGMNGAVVIFHETFDYKSWINLLKPKLEDNYSSCPFDDPNFPEVVDELRLQASVISIKSLEQNRLPNSIKLSDHTTQKLQNGTIGPTSVKLIRI